jgi:hypothetical protein
MPVEIVALASDFVFGVLRLSQHSTLAGEAAFAEPAAGRARVRL